MRSRKTIIVLLILNIIMAVIITNLLINREIEIEKQLIKEMTEGEYESKLTELNKSHEDYALQVQENKKKLATAITNPGVTTSGDDTFETMIINVSNILSNAKTQILYAKTNGSYTSESNEALYFIATPGGLWNSYYEPTVTGGNLTKINYLNNYHDTWSCNTGIYEWNDSKGYTITYSQPISNGAYPVTMVILK